MNVHHLAAGSKALVFSFSFFLRPRPSGRNKSIAGVALDHWLMPSESESAPRGLQRRYSASIRPLGGRQLVRYPQRAGERSGRIMTSAAIDQPDNKSAPVSASAVTTDARRIIDPAPSGASSANFPGGRNIVGWRPITSQLIGGILATPCDRCSAGISPFRNVERWR